MAKRTQNIYVFHILFFINRYKYYGMRSKQKKTLFLSLGSDTLTGKWLQEFIDYKKKDLQK